MKPFLVRLLLLLAPARSREWIKAIICEASQLDSAEQAPWLVAAARFALSERARTAVPTAYASSLAITMLFVDWTSGALVPALGLIGLSAVVLTQSSRGRLLPLAVASGTLPIAHAVANWVPGLRPDYQYAPLDLRDWVILAAVAAIGVCAVRVAELLPSRSARPGW
jgi:hypothetical protein